MEERITYSSETVVALPRGEHEEMIALRRVEWQHIRQRVEKLSNPLSFASEWSATFVGLGAGALLSLIPLLTGTEKQEGWVIPTFAVVGVSFMILALFMFLVHRRMQKHQSTHVDDLCSDMDEIANRYPHQDVTSSG